MNLILVKHFKMDSIIWIMESLNLDHGGSKMSQIMTMDHGYGPWSKSCRSDHDHGPNHDFVDHGSMSSQLCLFCRKKMLLGEE